MLADLNFSFFCSLATPSIHPNRHEPEKTRYTFPVPIVSSLHFLLARKNSVPSTIPFNTDLLFPQSRRDKSSRRLLILGLGEVGGHRLAAPRQPEK
ncbi:hypothetical protein TNCV_5136191 [Trichonephila clavipes]|nr:hypothetical protein TNCV_5136191 [Trichonephila clavipes]